MDIRNLKTFIIVAETGSFTKAAQMQGYAQSTISSQIKQLEDELQTRLFDRIGKTITLTDRGKEVLHYAHKISKLTKEMIDLFSYKDDLKGQVRFITASSMCRPLLGEAYLAFQKQYPEISVKFMTAGTDEMMRQLNHNEADLIYTLDSHIYSTEYVIAHEEKVGMHFIAPYDHPLAEKKELCMKDLIHENFILTEKEMSYRKLLDDKLASMFLEINPILETDNADQICWLVENGGGISFLPDYTTENALKNGKIVYLPVRDVEIDVWKQLIYHKDKWITPCIKTVIDYCSKL